MILLIIYSKYKLNINMTVTLKEYYLIDRNIIIMSVTICRLSTPCGGLFGAISLIC